MTVRSLEYFAPLLADFSDRNVSIVCWCKAVIGFPYAHTLAHHAHSFCTHGFWVCRPDQFEMCQSFADIMCSIGSYRTVYLESERQEALRWAEQAASLQQQVAQFA